MLGEESFILKERLRFRVRSRLVWRSTSAWKPSRRLVVSEPVKSRQRAAPPFDEPRTRNNCEPLLVQPNRPKWTETGSGVDPDEVVASLSDGVAVWLRFTDYGRRRHRQKEVPELPRHQRANTPAPCEVSVCTYQRDTVAAKSLPVSPVFWIPTVALTWRTILTLLVCAGADPHCGGVPGI